ncbi:hypothetical protein KUTeg_000802 [Tegillarca granosa]|uniref:C2H2-type domain-containing protein n=1 Tax=Tegillarca granosa TaxID=220873 RepID=A0ABQ9G1Q5_TEGGR|nr:hypothetical protein KUTeg_000802 [Tegillarca granosa]
MLNNGDFLSQNFTFEVVPSFTRTSKSDFEDHMTCHFEHICQHCGYKSRTEGRLKRHIKDFHTEDPPDGFGSKRNMGRPKVFRCKQCDFVATEKIDFWTHSRSHIKEEKVLQCPKCPFVTEYKHHLEYHLRNHFGSKPFKCNKCNYSCVNKSMLNSHMKSHTNVYQYRCADCTYATKYCHSLKLHLRKYNHKPATVLNNDGSLPQGVDAEASGLSLLQKRGPPRGPRGPRKDKFDPFVSHLLSMPPSSLPGMSPGFNGNLMSPYWPLMNQLPNGMHAPPPPLVQLTSSPVRAPLPPTMSQNKTPLNTGRPMIKEEGGIPGSSPLMFKCNFCIRGLLNFHQQHQKEHQRSALHVKTESGSESPKSSPHSWPHNSPNESTRLDSVSSRYSMPELGFGPYKNSNTSPKSEPAEGEDIIKQMMNKFGSGMPARRNTINGEIPLDLTKRTPHAIKNSMQNEAEVSSSGENSVSMENAVPNQRKRSRKGKAFKLDTLCLQLQQKQNDTTNESEEEGDQDSEYHGLSADEIENSKCDDNDDAASPGQSAETDDIDDENPLKIDEGNYEEDQENSEPPEKRARQDKDNEENFSLLNGDRHFIENGSPIKYTNENGFDKQLTGDANINLSLNGHSSMPEDRSGHAMPLALRRGQEIAEKLIKDSNTNGIIPNGHGNQDMPFPFFAPQFQPENMITPRGLSRQMGKAHKSDYECLYCDIAFRDCVMYTMHMGYHGYKDPYKCNMCGHSSKDKVEFFLHIARASHN